MNIKINHRIKLLKNKILLFNIKAQSLSKNKELMI